MGENQDKIEVHISRCFSFKEINLVTCLKLLMSSHDHEAFPNNCRKNNCLRTIQLRTVLVSFQLIGRTVQKNAPCSNKINWVTQKEFSTSVLQSVNNWC